MRRAATPAAPSKVVSGSDTLPSDCLATCRHEVERMEPSIATPTVPSKLASVFVGRSINAEMFATLQCNYVVRVRKKGI